MYTYFLKWESEEHLLYFREIAVLYGLYTLKKEPNSKLIGAMLRNYVYEVKFPEVYWSFPQKRVYPHAQYDPAVKHFLSQLKEGINEITFPDGKTFKCLYIPKTNVNDSEES
jgi:hypothetical protein